MAVPIVNWRKNWGSLFPGRLPSGSTPPPHTGDRFSLSPVSFPEGPVSEGLRVFSCGRNGSDFPAFCLQRAHSSLFSLLACGRVHELSPVFMGVSGIGLDLAVA
jgi:hypothetical protein